MAPRTALVSCSLRRNAIHRPQASCAAFYATHIASPAASIDAPENPKFVDIPMPPQERASYIPEVKGILPVPRQLFPRNGPSKTSPEYLAAVTQEPRRQPGATQSDMTRWKARAAELRRKNLREGLVELRRRKDSIDKTVGARSARRQALYEEAVHRPEREDERLTTPSLPQSLTSGSFLNITDPHRTSRIATSEQRVQAHQTNRSEEVRTDLHSLYMNARTFVVNEQDLNNLVENVFENDPWYQANPGRSIWDRHYGHPDTVADLLSATRVRDRAVRTRDKNGGTLGRRVTQIAEELTGGKL